MVKQSSSILSVVIAAGMLFLTAEVFHSFHTSAIDTPQSSQVQTGWHECEKLSADQTKDSNLKAVECYSAVAESARREKQLSFAVQVMRQAADVRLILGDTKGALEALEAGVQLARSARDLKEEGFCEASLAYVHFLRGDVKAVERSSLTALRLAHSIKSEQLEALALSTLGESYYSAGNLQLAQQYQRQALEACSKLGEQRCVTRAAVALGYYLVNLSEPRQALTFFEQGLEAATKANNLQGQAQSLNAIGNIKIKVGDYQGALNALNRARPLAERVGDRICLASILGGTSGTYLAMGEGSQSLRFISEALAIFEALDEKWGIAEAKLDLGRAHKALGNYHEASTAFGDSLKMFQSFGMKRLEMQTLSELADVQKFMGNLTEALDTYDQALRLSKLGQDQRHEAFLLTNIGETYEAQHKSEEALTLHQRALKLSRVALDPLLQLKALVNIARIERDQGRLEDAKRDIESAIDIAESVRARVSSPNLRTSYLASVHRAYEVSIDTLNLLHKQQPDRGFDREAFIMSEKAKARSFQDQVLAARARLRQSADPELLDKERSLSEQLNAKAELQMKMASKDAKAAAKLEEEIESLTAQYKEVQDQLRASNPIAAALTSSQTLSITGVQNQLLDHDSVLLEFSLGEERSYAWVISKTEASSYELAGRKTIEAVVSKLYDSLTAQQIQPGESADARYSRQRAAALVVPQQTKELSQLLLGQLIGKLQNKRIKVVPDGPLQYIPFSALEDPTTGQLLVMNHEILVEPSASALALIKKDSPTRLTPTRSVLVFADPVFERDDPRIKGGNGANDITAHSQQAHDVLRDIGLSNGQDIPRLISSGKEADAIMAAIPWKSGQKEVDFSANRENVMSGDVASFQILHFATHGASNSEHPELSGIVLSLFDSDGQSRDGVLRLHDIYDLRIPANMVVLSACSTGLGKDVRGEGLIGLSRGFMHAGAKSVVASLWKVDDEATAELMSHFYEGIFQKRLRPATALRFAQLEMAKQPRWQSPYYWAGFIIQGQDLTNEVITRNVALSKAEISVMSVSLVTMILLPGVLLWLRRRRGLS